MSRDAALGGQQDEGRLLAGLAGQLNRPHYAFAIDALPVPAVHAAHVLSGKKYPSPKNIAALFGRLGIPNIFDLFNKGRTTTEVFVVDGGMTLRNRDGIDDQYDMVHGTPE